MKIGWCRSLDGSPSLVSRDQSTKLDRNTGDMAPAEFCDLISKTDASCACPLSPLPGLAVLHSTPTSSPSRCREHQVPVEVSPLPSKQLFLRPSARHPKPATVFSLVCPGCICPSPWRQWASWAKGIPSTRGSSTSVREDEQLMSERFNTQIRNSHLKGNNCNHPSLASACEWVYKGWNRVKDI